jgi:hypothetical protein
MTFNCGWRAFNCLASSPPVIPSGITMSVNNKSIFPFRPSQIFRASTPFAASTTW